jgi:alpha-tubulin suppressor-like RCC1 family protein
LLVDDQGGVYGCGNNVVGQLGLVGCETYELGSAKLKSRRIPVRRWGT